MLSELQKTALFDLVHHSDMTAYEGSVLLLLAELRDSMARLVELAESDYADEDGPVPRSLGER